MDESKNQFQTGKSGRYIPRDESHKGGMENKGNKSAKSFGELGNDVKNEYFTSHFNGVLRMSTYEQPDGLILEIEQFVEKLGSKVSISQIRNIYDKVKKCESIGKLKLIRPQLAYIAGRAEKDYNAKKFVAFLDLLIQELNSKEQMKEFETFFEAVVAYHKYYGRN
jgi:CRISPR-associated protein Csm2